MVVTDSDPTATSGCGSNHTVTGTINSIQAPLITGEISLDSVPDNGIWDMTITLVYSSEIQVGLNGSSTISKLLLV